MVLGSKPSLHTVGVVVGRTGIGSSLWTGILHHLCNGTSHIVRNSEGRDAGLHIESQQVHYRSDGMVRAVVDTALLQDGPIGEKDTPGSSHVERPTTTSRKRKYYAVVKGRNPGMYETWASCEGQVKGFPGNQYKGFSTQQDASTYLKEHGIKDDAAEGKEVESLDNALVDMHEGFKARLEFDGASKKNPGPAGFGAVIFDDATNAVVREITGYIGDHGTNNQAEYAGLVAGLAACKQMGILHVKVKGDSKLVINQVLHKWQVKNEVLQRYHRKATDLIRSFASFEAEHVLRKFNTHADRLSNVAIEEKNMWNLDDV